MARELRLLSVVAPMLNEEALAGVFHERVSAALEGLPWELIVVDDGSTDGTAAVLDAIATRDERVQILHLSRSFGHQPALTAGLDHARGDAVVLIDGDLQDPPEVIPELVLRWQAGIDVVVARRRERSGETRFKLATARAFYRLMGHLAQVPLEPNAGDFRLLDRQVVDALGELRERNRFLRGMTAWVGFETGVVEYDRDARSGGTTKFSLGRMIRFAIDGVASFSHVPLQIATLLGFAFAALALALVPLTVVARYAGIYERGVPSVLFAVFLIGGIQLMTLGVIGEYVGRIYDEVKRRPLYVVKRDPGNPEAADPFRYGRRKEDRQAPRT
ncbi:MAG: glycosyltransferase family 2 protein [Solirubrobacterales bacterium]|nr:glycosyltransferase family 2 protein [Solirubrobacterales bacterium]